MDTHPDEGRIQRILVGVNVPRAPREPFAGRLSWPGKPARMWSQRTR